MFLLKIGCGSSELMCSRRWDSLALLHKERDLCPATPETQGCTERQQVQRLPRGSVAHAVAKYMLLSWWWSYVNSNLGVSMRFLSHAKAKIGRESRP